MTEMFQKDILKVFILLKYVCKFEGSEKKRCQKLINITY